MPNSKEFNFFVLSSISHWSSYIPSTQFVTLFFIVFLVTAPGCNLWFWCFYLHLMSVRRRSHTCWYYNPPVPNPILESKVLQSSSLFPRMPVLFLPDLQRWPFLVTVVLQSGLRNNQRLSRATAQRGGAVLAISDQWVQRVGLLVDDNEVDQMADLHSKTDLEERYVSVRR